MNKNLSADIMAINTLKINGVAAVNKANSGHPGIVLGAATIMHTLFSRHMIYDPKNPKFINRDRFVLSAGHGSALLYSQLYLLGLATKSDLENFRQIGSRTPGHPEYGFLPGVEATTGPLGQGIAMAVGMAIAEESLRARFNEIGHYTYVLCGDGDLQEGVANEALSLAGFQKLSKLIIIFDSNNVQLDTLVNKVFNENMAKKMEALGFKYIFVKNNDLKAIDKALQSAKKSDKPVFIEVKTIIGDGATNAGTSKVHGAPLGNDFDNVKASLKWTESDFNIPLTVKQLYDQTIIKRSQKAVQNFKMSPGLKKFLTAKPKRIEIEIEKNLATRASSGKVIEYLNLKFPNWIGGSADLAGSTKAFGGDGDFSPLNRRGRNILFGVREFAMAAIGNGLALHSNFYPFVSTFFVFTDYLKPALRLSAMMKLPVTYIMTHDSIWVGEDGPTHEPIEQLAMVRAIPNVNVVRPADEKEVLGAFDIALNQKHTPTIIALTRQNIKSLDETNRDKVASGSYELLNFQAKWTLISSGSELANAVKIAKELKINCVSLVNSTNAKITWNKNFAISIEASTTFGMQKFANYNLGIDTFGESGPGEKVNEHFKLDYNSLFKRVKHIIEQNNVKKES